MRGKIPGGDAFCGLQRTAQRQRQLTGHPPRNQHTGNHGRHDDHQHFLNGARDFVVQVIHLVIEQCVRR
ncbi:hypothetical protein D3C80_2046620 [compost metagenome]